MFISANNIVCVAYLITIILAAVLYGCETQSLTSSEECRLKVLQYRVLRRVLWFKREKVTGSGENYIMRSSMICPPHSMLFG
jgi:hypothetical protein